MYAELLGSRLRERCEDLNGFTVKPDSLLCFSNKELWKPIGRVEFSGVFKGLDGSNITSCFPVCLSQPKPQCMVVRLCSQRNLERLDCSRVVLVRLIVRRSELQFVDDAHR